MKQALVAAPVEGFIEGSDDQALVMIHGWPDTYRIWSAQVAYFKAHYRCAYFTLPGFAPNAEQAAKQAFSLDQVIEVIKAVVDEASPTKPVHLMLHDWGCFFGYQFALRYPQRVASIIGVDVGDANSRAFRASLGAKQMALIAGYQLPLLSAWRLGGRIGNSLARGVAKVLKAPVDPALIHANMGYPYYIQWTQHYGSYKAARDLNFSCPMLYIYARHKPIMFHSPQWLAQLEQQDRSAVVAMNTSHWAMVEQPELFNQTVHDWLSNL